MPFVELLPSFVFAFVMSIQIIPYDIHLLIGILTRHILHERHQYGCIAVGHDLAENLSCPNREGSQQHLGPMALVGDAARLQATPCDFHRLAACLQADKLRSSRSISFVQRLWCRLFRLRQQWWRFLSTSAMTSRRSSTIQRGPLSRSALGILAPIPVGETPANHPWGAEKTIDGIWIFR